jgi:formylglycine-generating enzyme required for sulfatase activity
VIDPDATRTSEAAPTPADPTGQFTPRPEGVPQVDISLHYDALVGDDTCGTVGAPSANSEFPAVPGYTITGEIARGGMGVVYAARQAFLNRPVALKMILGGGFSSATARSRFVAEAELSAALRHPHIVEVYEFSEYQGLPYFSLEFIGGGTLDGKTSAGPLPAREAAELTLQVAQAVAYAHSKGVIHRDLKPANVLLTADGSAKVTDFGLGKRTDTDTGVTQTGAIMGTPSYMAPEQARGDTAAVGPPCDTYAVGGILYKLLTGRPPFQGESAHVTISQVIGQEPVRVRLLNPQIPKDLETICHKCLRKDPVDRYASAAALTEDLTRFLAGRPIHARPVGLTRRAVLWIRRHPGRAAGLAVAVLLAALAATLGSAVRARTLERERQDELVAELLAGEPAAVPAVSARVDRMRALTKLRVELASGDARRGLNAALILGGEDPEAATILTRRALVTDPDELHVIQTAFQPGVGRVEEWWAIAEDRAEPTGARMRAAALLARVQPESTRWAGQTEFILDQLMAEPPSLVPVWSALFRGIGPQLRLQHEQRILTEMEPERVEALLGLMALYEAETLAKFGGPPPPPEVPVPVLREEELKTQLTWPGNALERWARVRARATALGFRNRPADTWTGLSGGPDPRLRSYLVHDLARVGVPAEALMQHFWPETDTAVRQGILLALGEYDASRVSSAGTRFLTQLEDTYRTDPDPGVHSAAYWLAGRWGQGGRYADLDRVFAGQPTPSARQWEVAPDGVTFARINGPAEVVTGSPVHEFYREQTEAEREVRRLIPRDYALATAEVTAGRYLEMYRDLATRPVWATFGLLGGAAAATTAHANRPLWGNPIAGHLSRYYPTADCPMGEVHPRNAMVYCRWLSERHGVPEDQMCYPPIWEIFAGVPPYPDFVARTGYRLPTEAEWEHAARGGCRLPFHFGATAFLLDKFGWSNRTSADATRPVGRLKPNGLGLFDIHGNVLEWCHGSRALPTDPGGGSVVVDLPVARSEYEYFTLRGGSFARVSGRHRLAERWGFGSLNEYQPNLSTGDMGFRLARTIGPVPVVAVERFDRRRESFTLKLAGRGKFRIDRREGDANCAPAAGDLPAAIRVTGTLTDEKCFGFSVALEGTGEELRVWRDPAESTVRVVYMRTVAGMQLALIPAGRFTQGTDREELRWLHPAPHENGREEASRRSESPARPVTISKPFALGATEVTVGQFRAFVVATGYRPVAVTDSKRRAYDGVGRRFGPATRPRWDAPGYPIEKDHPVTALVGEDVAAYTAWFSKQAGAEYRLPTEAEWEYACRAGSASLWACGESGALLAKYAWHSLPAPGSVARLRPNAFGLYDMTGNVGELVADRWENTGYSPDPVTDPRVTPNADWSHQSVRGGSFDAWHLLGYCRPGRRDEWDCDTVYNNIGFRVAGPAWTPALAAEVIDHRVGREFDLTGSATDYAIEGIAGEVRAEPASGPIPRTVVVSAPAGRTAGYALTLRPTRGGRSARVAGAFLYPRWTVSYRPWSRGADHGNAALVQRTLASPPLWTGEVLGPKLDLPWIGENMPRMMPATWFLAELTTRVELTAGRYELSVAVDTGARIFLDGKQVLSTWPWGRPEAAKYEVDLPAGAHDLRIEAYQWERDQRFRFAIRGLGP